MTSVRRSAGAGVVCAIAIAIAAASPADSSPGVACPSTHVDVLAHAGSVRIIIDVAHVHLGARRILVCQGGRGVVVGRKLVTPEDTNDTIVATIIHGHFAALVQNSFISDGDGEVNVVVVDAPTHTIAIRAFASTEAADGVERAVLAANGAIAWVTTEGVLKLARHGGPSTGCFLDHGPVTPSSLHLSGPSTATWMDGSTSHSQPLVAASCVP